MKKPSKYALMPKKDLKVQPTSESGNAAKLPVIRRPFDAEIKDGKVIIYTNHYDEFGDVVWNANFIEPERFKELAKKYWSTAAFL